MKRVHEIDKVRPGQHIRFTRMGSAKGQDGSRVEGEVIGHREDGTAVVRTYDGTETWFSHSRGDRISKVKATKIMAPVLAEDGWAPPCAVDKEFHDAHVKRASLHFRIAAFLAGAGFVSSVGLVVAVILKFV